MYCLLPEPNKRIITERLNNSDPELVLSDSPKWKHKEMFIRARDFNRGIGYGTILWGENGDDYPDVHGYLFCDAVGRIVGVCSFRNRTEVGRSEIWALQWIWVCPLERGTVICPADGKPSVSALRIFMLNLRFHRGMEDFLLKHGDQHLMMWQYDRDGHS